MGMKTLLFSIKFALLAAEETKFMSYLQKKVLALFLIFCWKRKWSIILRISMITIRILNGLLTILTGNQLILFLLVVWYLLLGMMRFSNASSPLAKIKLRVEMVSPLNFLRNSGIFSNLLLCQSSMISTKVRLSIEIWITPILSSTPKGIWLGKSQTSVLLALPPLFTKLLLRFWRSA